MSETQDILDEARDFLRSHGSADEVARYPTAALVLRLADELRQTRAELGDTGKQQPVAWLCKAMRHDGTTSSSLAFTSSLASVGNSREDGYISWWKVPLFCAPRWIPVGERLPENKRVLIASRSPNADKINIDIGDVDADGVWRDDQALTLNEVIAWIPLPEPPQGDADERREPRGL